MASSYDGDIMLSVGLDAKDARKTAKDLKNEINKVFESQGSKEQKSQIATLNKQMKEATAKANELSDQIDKLSNAKTPTEEYNNLKKELNSTLETIVQLENRLRKGPASGMGDKEWGAVYKSLNRQLDQANSEVSSITEKMQNLEQAGKAFTLGKDTEEFTRLTRQLDSVNDKTKILLIRYNQLQNPVSKATERMKGLKDATEKVRKSAAKAANTTSKGFAQVNAGVGKVIKKLLAYGIGIRSLYALFGKLRKAVTEGFANFYASSSQFKKKVDDLKTSVTTLKNSFAAAFAPIVELAIPYIQKLIEWLTKLMGYVAQFTAAITGQKKYTKAIKQTGEAAEKANKQLSGLDKLNVINSDNGGETGTNAFEEVPIDAKMIDFVEQLKDKLKGVVDYATKLKDIFKQGFFDSLGDWQSKWENIKQNAKNIRDTVAEIATDPSVMSAGDMFMQSLARTLGSTVGFFATVGITIAQNLVGGMAKYLQENKDRIKKYLIDMFDIGTKINEQTSAVMESLGRIFDVFGGENGQALTANIIGIFADAFMGVNELAGKLGRDIVTLITQPIIDNEESFRTAFDGLLKVFADVTETLKEAVDDVLDHLNQMYDEHIAPFFESLTKGVSELTGVFLEFWNKDVQPILDEWAKEFDQLWKEHLQPMLNEFSDLIGAVFDLFKAKWESQVKPAIDWCIKNLLPVLMPIIKTLGSLVISAVGTIADSIKNLLSIIKNTIQLVTRLIQGDWRGSWESAKNIVSSVVNIMKDLTKGLGDFIKKIFDGIINTITAGWSKLTSIGSGIKGLFDSSQANTSKLSVSRQSISPSLLNIPAYANGQVIPPSMAKHLAILGDNNKETEVVSPVSTMKQAFLEAIAESGLLDDNKEVVVNIDGSELLRIMMKQNSDYKKQTGGVSAFA